MFYVFSEEGDCFIDTEVQVYELRQENFGSLVVESRVGGVWENNEPLQGIMPYSTLSNTDVSSGKLISVIWWSVMIPGDYQAQEVGKETKQPQPGVPVAFTDSG